MMVSKMQITSLLLIHSYSNVGYKEHPAQRPLNYLHSPILALHLLCLISSLSRLGLFPFPLLLP